MAKKRKAKTPEQQDQKAAPFFLSRNAKNAFTVLFILAFALAFFLRFYDLERKPLHHDEGVNSWFLLNLKKDFPNGWKYDPANYHGPFLFFTHIIPLALKESIFSLRCGTALLGSLLILLLWPLRRKLGRAGVAGAAVLLAVSPTNLFFARTNIHETYLIFFTLAAVVCAIRFWESQKAKYFILMAASAALVITVKETYIVTAGVFFWSAAFTCYWFKSTQKKNELPPGAVLGQTGRWLGGNSHVIWLSLGVFVFIIVIYYSSLFTNLKGTTGDLIKTLLIWKKTGTKGAGHEKPFGYFFRLLKDFELPILIFGVLGIGYAFIRRNAFLVFTSFWAVLLLLGYSLIPYKTPWLALNFILPLALLAGYFFQNLYLTVRESKLQSWLTGAVGIALLICWGAGKSWPVNFIHYDDDSYQLVYSQTRRDLNNMIEALESYAQKQAQGYNTEIKILADEYWPIQWYLRDYEHVGFWGKVIDDPDAPIIIGRTTTQNQLEAGLKDTYASELYSLRPGVDLILYTRLRRGKRGEEELRSGKALEITPENLRPGLLARYFRKISPVGKPDQEKVESEIDFRYDSEEEKPMKSPFSILWEGIIEIPRDGLYVFATESDDGSWVFIDDKLVVDNGGTHAIQYKSDTIRLTRGFHRIRVKYFDSAWGAIMKLLWTPPEGPEGPIPPELLWHRK